MRAGRLRHRLTIKNPEASRSASGQSTLSYEHAETVWGGVEPLSVKERVAGEQRGAMATHRIVLRYTALLTHRSQILFGDREFEVAEILNRDERNRELNVLCTEKR